MRKSDSILEFKVKASTLVEAIIAMLIVTIAFSMALVLMLNISKNSNNSLKTKAYILANDVLVKTKTEKTANGNALTPIKIRRRPYFDTDLSDSPAIIGSETASNIRPEKLAKPKTVKTRKKLP